MRWVYAGRIVAFVTNEHALFYLGSICQLPGKSMSFEWLFINGKIAVAESVFIFEPFPAAIFIYATS